MFDPSKFSRHYRVRRMGDSDAEEILELCLHNEQYYRYCGKQPSRELILRDLHLTPPDTSAEDKYYVGFSCPAAHPRRPKDVCKGPLQNAFCNGPLQDFRQFAGNLFD